VPVFGQDAQLNEAAPDIARQVAGSGKKLVAFAFFTNTQGYGPHFSDYLVDTLSTMLTSQGKPFEILARNRFSQIMAERGLSASSDFDPKFLEHVAKFAFADAVFGGSYEVKDNDVRLNVQLLDVSDGRILIAKFISIPRTPEVDKELNHTPVKQFADVAAEIGLNAIEHGSFTKEEDGRLKSNIKKAKTIKVLVPNGDNLFFVLKKDLQDFFYRPGTSMRVIFASPESDFYREETQMTNLKSEEGDPAYVANRGKVADSRGRLLTYTRDASQVEFKYFDTQFRLPIIIVDDRYCYLTIRLSPNEAPQSVRMEFEGGAEPFADSCLAHFERMWTVSSSSPQKKTAGTTPTP
jgi:TolB-like protein